MTNLERLERIAGAARGLIVQAFRLGGGPCFISPDQDGQVWLWSGDGRDPEAAEPVLCLDALAAKPEEPAGDVVSVRLDEWDANATVEITGGSREWRDEVARRIRLQPEAAAFQAGAEAKAGQVAGLDMQQIKLQMGELTAQEERTLRAFQALVSALPLPEMK